MIGVGTFAGRGPPWQMAAMPVVPAEQVCRSWSGRIAIAGFSASRSLFPPPLRGRVREGGHRKRERLPLTLLISHRSRIEFLSMSAVGCYLHHHPV
jgi:hypothetical protein